MVINSIYKTHENVNQFADNKFKRFLNFKLTLSVGSLGEMEVRWSEEGILDWQVDPLVLVIPQNGDEELLTEELFGGYWL